MDVDMLVRLADQVLRAGAARAAHSPASARAVLVAQLWEGLGAAAAAGDIEVVRVAHEAIGPLLGLAPQNAVARVQAPLVDLVTSLGKRR